ncbi:hypothetical protein BS78_09G019000 [Paspalum vaginatum]|nr:hypothetical protein BS78_09G019000 [Paspalum vaginatum]
MASAASMPGRRYLLVAAVVSLLLISMVFAVESCDGMGTGQCVVHRRGTTAAPPLLHSRYVLAEKSKGTAGASSDLNNRSAPAAAPPAVLAKPSGGAGGHKQHRVPKWAIIVASSVAVGSIAAFAIVSGLLLVPFRLANRRWYNKTRSRSGIAVFTPKLIRRAEHLAFLEEDDGDVLASLEMIGRGGCGEVYKAQLLPVEREGPEDELLRFIAIKRVRLYNNAGDAPSNLSNAESRQLDRRSRQVQSEIRTVGHIRHRNLLPLAAHVPRRDCHYLVYEYMKNGSLDGALKAGGGGGVVLPWPARTHIAVGVAAGLEYLQHSHRPAIMHRDLKPANVLLGDDLEALVTDFGLAKVISDAHTHVTASAMAGKLGYIAPEYHGTLKFTPKCDVYSFGVILAVLATGKAPSDEFFITHMEPEAIGGLVKWLRGVMLAGNHAVAIDPGYDDQVVLVLRTADDPKNRPSAREVRCML